MEEHLETELRGLTVHDLHEEPSRQQAIFSTGLLHQQPVVGFQGP